MKLNRYALTTLAENGVRPVDYITHYCPDGQWEGDACGCVDDRCIGYHHDNERDCGCIEVLIDQYVGTISGESDQ